MVNFSTAVYVHFYTLSSISNYSLIPHHGLILSIFFISCLLWLQTSLPALTEHSLTANHTCCLGSRKCTVNFDLKGATRQLMQFDIFCNEMHVLPCSCCNLFFLSSCHDGYKFCKFTELINEFSHYSCNSLSSCICNYLLHSLSSTHFYPFSVFISCALSVQSALASRERSVPELIGLILLSSLSVSKEAIRVIFENMCMWFSICSLFNYGMINCFYWDILL